MIWFIYISTSWLLCKRKCQIHRLLIVIGRESVVNTSICYGDFGCSLESITTFYKKLPDDKFDITTTLVQNFNNEVKEKGYIRHFPNNFNKYTYYYTFIDKILLLEAKYGLDTYKKISLHSKLIFLYVSL